MWHSPWLTTFATILIGLSLWLATEGLEDRGFCWVKKLTGMAGNYSLWPADEASKPQQTQGLRGANLEGFLARVEIDRVAIYARVSTHDRQTLPRT
jgi:hypothetical protein